MSQRPHVDGVRRRHQDELAEAPGVRDRGRGGDEYADSVGEHGVTGEEACVVCCSNLGSRDADVVGEVDGGRGALVDENTEGVHY